MGQMKSYRCTDEPFKIHGVYAPHLPERFWRLPEELLSKVSEGIVKRAKSPLGGRVRFRTDSGKVTIRTILKNNEVDWAIPLTGSAGADVYIGSRMNSRFAGTAVPRSYEELEGVLTFEKERKLEDITIYLPRNVELVDVIIEVEEDAAVEAPRPYTIERPMVFYGSSITEGGCATRTANGYPALLSRWLDADYLNLGFSASAKGEPEMAEYIAGLEMSVLIMDYDHNAPTAEHLEATHERFFQEIRRRQPELPILLLSRPDFDRDPEDSAKRREVIQMTYERAKAAGDRHVYFIDGERLFGTENREACTVDGCHPNDLGFMRMAETIYPVLHSILMN